MAKNLEMYDGEDKEEKWEITGNRGVQEVKLGVNIS
jgi:hypothetical protein